MPSISLGKEPTLIIQAFVAVLNVVQIGAISMPTWVHGLVAALVIAAGAVLNRSQVSPVSKPPIAPGPAG